MGFVGQIMWFSTLISRWFYYYEVGVAMSAMLAFSFFGQTVADITTPIEYRRSRLLSQPLWLAVYLYTVSFLLVIAFNKLEAYTSRQYFKFVFHREANKTASVTLNSQGTSSRNSLKRVDDDEDTESPVEEQYIRRIHHNTNQTRWISLIGLRSFSSNLMAFCFLALLDCICFEAFIYNTADIYQ